MLVSELRKKLFELPEDSEITLKEIEVIFMRDSLSKTLSQLPLSYIAIITEKGAMRGQSIGNTKVGKYKGMTKEQFEKRLKKNTCWNFEIQEFH